MHLPTPLTLIRRGVKSSGFLKLLKWDVGQSAESCLQAKPRDWFSSFYFLSSPRSRQCTLDLLTSRTRAGLILCSGEVLYKHCSGNESVQIGPSDTGRLPQYFSLCRLRKQHIRFTFTTLLYVFCCDVFGFCFLCNGFLQWVLWLSLMISGIPPFGHLAL